MRKEELNWYYQHQKTTQLLRPVISRYKNAVVAASFKCGYSDFIHNIIYYSQVPNDVGTGGDVY